MTDDTIDDVILKRDLRVRELDNGLTVRVGVDVAQVTHMPDFCPRTSVCSLQNNDKNKSNFVATKNKDRKDTKKDSDILLVMI